MKYIIRAIKYFVYFAVIMTLIITVLVLIGAVEGNIDSIFKDGINSIWKILGFLAVISAVYPAFGFMEKTACIHGSWEENRDKVVEFMESRDYRISKEDADGIVFRCKGVGGKISRMWEDAVTVKPDIMGVSLEGYRKDLVRLVMGLEHKLNSGEEN